MNLEQAIKDEVEKWCMKSGWDEYNEPAIDFAASLYFIAMATADALRVEVVRAHTCASENAEVYRAVDRGQEIAISDSLQREQEWFGIKAETPLVDNKEV